MHIMHIPSYNGFDDDSFYDHNNNCRCFVLANVPTHSTSASGIDTIRARLVSAEYRYHWIWSGSDFI
ncbi:hypothetical protein Hypma_012524 [Hypsizygus marmoreus]|uniref:Uncharacterized protein n=1 Tax=Hypsizygus marmoreus TaxID=39966 RepID=A0A369JE17_HYPMA|nr:hypothetical protein Hypma_012524 [Hypsizygus marmoreus]